MRQRFACCAAILLAAVVACSRDRSAEVDAHMAALKSEDAVTRRDAVVGLGQMGSSAADAVPALMRVMKDPNDDIRVAAAESLGKIGPPAQAALSALEAATKDRDERVQAAAAEAIRKIKAGP